MATDPFGVAFEALLKLNIQGGKLFMLKQHIADPQFYCCISGNTVGVAKDPVPVLVVDPTIYCIGDPVTADFSRSWSPTDTLAAQPWVVEWGDGSPDANGNFPDPRNPAAENTTKAAGYAAAGFYNITLTVDDSTGASASTRVQILVVDCTADAPDPDYDFEIPFELPGRYSEDADNHLLGGLATVYYTTNFSAVNPNWTGLDNGTLAVTEVQDLKMEYTSFGDETIYLVDHRNIWAHPLPPWLSATWVVPTEGTWNQMVTDAGINPAVYTLGALKHMCISTERNGWQWVLWSATDMVGATGRDTYVGVAHTRNGWETVQYSAIVEHMVGNAALTQYESLGEVAIDQHSEGDILFATFSFNDKTAAGDDRTELWRSADKGQHWTYVAHRDTWSYSPSVHVSYADSDYVYWCDYQDLMASVGGRHFRPVANIPGGFNQYRHISGSLTDKRIVNLVTSDFLYEWTPSGGLQQFSLGFPAPNLAHRGIVRGRTDDENVNEWLWAGGQIPAVGTIRNNKPLGVSEDKDNLWPVGCIYGIAVPELEEYWEPPI